MLLSVRLTRDDERVVRGLRRANVNVSELVRRALRQAAAAMPRSGVKRSVALKQIIDAFPGPEAAHQRPALDDRRAIAASIAKKLARKTKRR